MADLVTRLLLNTQQFDNNLGKSTKQIQGFQQKIQGFSNMAISSFTKFAGGIGIALTAGEAFNKALRSCQATSDLFDNNLNAAKDTVDSFFRSLVTGDWNVFNEGILGAYRNLKDLSMMMDELADKKLSLGYIKADDLKDMERFEQIAKDTNKTYDERINAVQNMQGVINHLNKSIKETNDLDIQALNKSYASKSGLNINREDLDYFFKNTNFKGELTTAANDAYKEYLRLQKEASKKYAANKQDVNTFGYDPSRRYQKEYLEAKKALDIYQQQNDFLIKQGWLTEETDDNRKQTVDRLKEQLQAEKEIYSLQKRADETRRSVTNSNKSETTLSKIETTKITSKTEIIPSGSIAELNKQLSDWRDKFNNATTDEARDAAHKMIAELENKIIIMKAKIEYDLTDSNINQQLEYEPKVTPKLDIESLNTDLKSEVQNINKKYQDQLSVLSSIDSLEKETRKTRFNLFEETTNGINNTISSVEGLVSILEDPDASGWEKFFAVLRAGFSITDTITGVISTIQSLMEITNALSAAKAVANATEIAGNIAVESSYKGVAAAKIMAAHAYIPFAGVGIASGQIAAMIAAIEAAKAFAGGGIVSGSSFVGDNMFARVNSGEMILNNRQQRNLFNLLNGNGGITNDNVKEIKLKIEGRDLVSVINSENFRTSKFK